MMKIKCLAIAAVPLLLLPKGANAAPLGSILVNFLANLMCWIPILKLVACNDCAFRNDPCLHGACQDKIGSYKCTCEAGWSGTDCDSTIDDDSSAAPSSQVESALPLATPIASPTATAPSPVPSHVPTCSNDVATAAGLLIPFYFFLRPTAMETASMKTTSR